MAANQVVDLTKPDVVKIYVPGKPQSNLRPAHWKGRVVDPVGNLKKAFAAVVKEQVPEPLFVKRESLEISVWFYLERPAEDFVNKTRYGGHLKPDKALMRLAPVKPDVDNLAKFVLDAMTGVVYGDDKQVVTLHLMKLHDNIGECRGGTYIRIKELI